MGRLVQASLLQEVVEARGLLREAQEEARERDFVAGGEAASYAHAMARRRELALLAVWEEVEGPDWPGSSSPATCSLALLSCRPSFLHLPMAAAL